MNRPANESAGLTPATEITKHAGAAAGPFEQATSKSRLVTSLLVVVLAASFALDCAMITRDRFGDYGDDGIYATAAKSLATGRGYRIISLPTEEPQTLVPPLYPFLLALIWKAYPHFPENIPWMMLLSVVATLALLVGTYRYLTRLGYATEWQALIVVALVGLNWRTMLHGTSVMAEMVYAALAVLALYLSEKYVQERGSTRAGVAVGVVMGLAFLTRTSGITLLLAFLCYSIFRSQLKRALLPAAVASLFVVAWIGWSYLNRPAADGGNALYYSSYAAGMNQTIRDLQVLNGTSWSATLFNIVGTNALLLIIGSIPLSTLGLRFDLPQFILVPLVLLTIILITAGFIRHVRMRVSLLSIYIILYLGIHVIHPGTAYDRYIVPICPFLVLLLVSELSVPFAVIKREFKTGAGAAGRFTAGVIALALAGACAVVIYSNFSAVYQSLTSVKKISEAASEGREAIEWIKNNTEPSDILVSNKDMVYYLYTDRRTTPSFQLSKLDGVPYQSQLPESEDITRTLLDTINESRGDYLISNLNDYADVSEFYRQTINGYLRQHPEKFVPVFESSNKNNVIYRILRNNDH